VRSPTDTTRYPPLGDTIAQVRDNAIGVGLRELMITAAAACLAGRDDAMKDIGQALVFNCRAEDTFEINSLN
jgi:hypothetical protein